MGDKIGVSIYHTKGKKGGTMRNDDGTAEALWRGWLGLSLGNKRFHGCDRTLSDAYQALGFGNVDKRVVRLFFG